MERPSSAGYTQENAIDLGGGLRLWLPDKQQRSAAEYVIKEIFSQRRYERPGFEIKPTDTIVDVGANIGIFSIWAAQKASQGKILAVEPTSVIDVLKFNIEKNGVYNVIPVRNAAGPDDQTWEFKTYPGFNIINHRNDWEPMVVTRLAIKLLYGRYQSKPVIERAFVKSLERILDENGVDRVDYCKIDCEGGEYEIFRNLSTRGFERLGKIAMEFHEYSLGQDHRKLVKLLRDHGFTVEVQTNFFEHRFMKYGMLWAKRGSDLSSRS
jgi:FkbM family methyltransferase